MEHESKSNSCDGEVDIYFDESSSDTSVTEVEIADSDSYSSVDT
jgi:hypothetical protein